jgi:hypothetical protein
MKATRYSFRLAILLLLTAVTTLAGAQTFKRSKSLVKTFPYYKETELQVYNKYGNITLIPWEKDSIRMEVSVSVVSNKEAKADKSFGLIDLDFKASRYYVIAKTVFAGQKDVWSDVTDLASGFFSPGTTTSVNYTIYLPASTRLTLENKYGDLFFTGHNGRTDIKLSNGNLKAHALSGETSLRIDYGKAEINELDKAKIALNYSDLRLGSGNFISIDSKSSTLNLDETQELNLLSKRDKIKITKVGSANGRLNFSSCSIGSLSETAELSAEYGKISLPSLSKSLTSLKLQGNNTDITLILNKSNSYPTVLNYTSLGEVLVPAQLNEKKITDLTPDKKNKKLECIMGDIQKPKVELDIKVSGGRLDIKF